MSLAAAKAGLKQAVLNMMSVTDPISPDAAATQLADAIDAYVSAATVTVTPSGGMVAGPYPVTGSATGGLS